MTDAHDRLRIGFDARYTRLGRHDGISRFGASLAESASRLADVTLIVADPRQLEMLPELPHVMASSPTSWREPGTMTTLDKHGFDVVFSPMQTIGSFFRRTPLVLTVHDLIYYEHPTPPRFLPGPVRLLWRLYHLSYAPQRWLLNRADAVAVVSQTTADLLREKKLTRAPVFVVPNAAADLPDDAGAGAAAAPSESVLRVEREPAQRADLVYMGSFMPYKGVEKLIEAVGGLPGFRLHLVSRPDSATRERLEALIARAGADVVFHNGLSDADYVRLLRSSAGLVTASSAEGFGLPLVEAQSLGVPVAVSDIPIFHEVAGESAVYFDQTSTESVRQGLTRLVDEGPERGPQGRAQAATFSWERSAEALVEACRAAIEVSRATERPAGRTGRERGVLSRWSRR